MVRLTCGDLGLCIPYGLYYRYSEKHLTHYIFIVAAKDINRFYYKWIELGMKIKKDIKKIANLYFVDPDGHKLELQVLDLASRLP